MVFGGGRAVWVPAALAALALTALVAPPRARANCGGVRTERARRDVGPGIAPLAVGDSTMLLPIDDLARAGFDVNAHGCRQFPEGLAVLRSARRRHRLPHLVVLALGADASISRSEIRAALRIVGRERILALVTPRELGGWAGHDAAVVRDEARHHPHRIVLLDWVAMSRGHGAWFQPDGLHLTASGAAAFTRLLRRALPYAPEWTRPRGVGGSGHL